MKPRLKETIYSFPQVRYNGDCIFKIIKAIQTLELKDKVQFYNNLFNYKPS